MEFVVGISYVWIYAGNEQHLRLKLFELLLINFKLLGSKLYSIIVA